MSKYNTETKMLEPFEEKLYFTEDHNPNYGFASGKNQIGVLPVKFGLNILRFTEMAIESYSNGGIVVLNQKI